MKENKKHDRRNKIIGWVLFVFLLWLPVLFDFDSASMVGKVLMVIGSVCCLLIYILLFVTMLKNNSNNISKSQKKKNIAIFVIIFILYVWLLLRYFDPNIWGTFGFVVIAFLIMVLWGCYTLVNNLRPMLNNEKVTVMLISVAIFFYALSWLLSEVDSKASKVLLIIAIGISYAFFISILLNALMSSDKGIKNRIIFIAFLVTIGVALLILFPFYVQWCGLTGNNFIVFATTYAAIVGGALTLIGVAWTIRHNKIERINEAAKREEERKEDERKKYIPYLKIDNGADFVRSAYLSFLDIEEDKEEVAYAISIKDFYIKNLSLTVIIIKGIMIDNKFCRFDNEYILAKDDSCKISSKGNKRFGCKEMPKNIAIIVQDAIGNEYRLDCNVNKEEHKYRRGVRNNSDRGIMYNYSIVSLTLPTLNNKVIANEEQ